MLLTTLNARYSHSSLGLRYLWAQMGRLRSRTQLREFTIHQRAVDIVEQLLAQQPLIIGIGVYIWNVALATEIVQLVKCVAPEVVVVLGGPEVSYEWQQQPLVAAADYLITGQADLAFAALCEQLLADKPPPQRVIAAPAPKLTQLQLPYEGYHRADIAHRLIYVEASRGCPFKCQFCLSALDRTAVSFPLAPFLAAMSRLWQRGVRQFKFVDRTFNLKPATTVAILEHFLPWATAGLRLHFELIPDHLPERLKQTISRFPSGVLQFEIGIQSLNSQVLQRLERKQSHERTVANLAWLQQQQIHLHTDLIIGLPGESLESIAAGFNTLWSLQVAEIQVGVLKRLRGAPIVAQDEPWQMRYLPYPPYTVISTSELNFATLQRLSRFGRYWEMLGNRGHFRHTLALFLQDNPFAQFLALSDWLYETTRQTHKITLLRQFELLWRYGEQVAIAPKRLRQALAEDYRHSGDRLPRWLQSEPN
ncbi:DUF4080 domain-containing protein [Ectothiorhodospiraceae bacterium BW-2]|nr:DUF4080 domain-containing protein [Ectothiorhodospiraceae bacterium BW-2]